MTGPESERDRETALVEADQALRHAETLMDRGAKIAAGWRQSRQDNNFRLMLRALGQRAEHSG